MRRDVPCSRRTRQGAPCTAASCATCAGRTERRSLAVGWADVPLCRAALAFNAEADAEEAAADAEEKAARFRACTRRRARQGARGPARSSAAASRAT